MRTLLFALLMAASTAFAAPQPNIIVIVADDLGYGEVGCYGQKKIRTPCMDQLAKEGARFTDYYAASAVCAPSRCMTLTGLHSGHAFIRDNRELKHAEGQEAISADSVLVSEYLKSAGYATAAIGKWGLGLVGSTGDPNQHGFDLFYGYNCQRQAHSYYPDHLWRNGNKIPLDGKTYSHDLIESEALEFISAYRDRPFFLYFAPTLPHINLQIPDDRLKDYIGQWDEPDASHPRATYAAMITRFDLSVGRVIKQLRSLGLDERTIVIITSDNGTTHDVGGVDSPFFHSTGPLRGRKGSLYEGGIRVPFIVRWPGRIKAGSTNNRPFAGYDLFPTICKLAGIKPPAGLDGVDIFSNRHPYLYWEFPGYGGQQAVRLDNWKAIRTGLAKTLSPIQLYDLRRDIGEQRDVARRYPDIVKRIEKIMADNHQPSELFPIPALDIPGK